MTRRIAICLAAFFAWPAIVSCTPAHAQPVDVISVAAPLTCDEGVVWQRSSEIAFCTTVCTADADCASGERCRVLDEGQKPDEVPLYAEEMQGELADAAFAVAEAAAEPIFDIPPVCEGDCAPYTGDLAIHPAVPTALCDPFHDVEGAMLSEADEVDIAAAEAATD